MLGLGAGLVLLALILGPMVLWTPIGGALKLSTHAFALIAAIAGIIAARRFVVIPYNKLMARVHLLQREVAMTMLREESRRRLDKARK